MITPIMFSFHRICDKIEKSCFQADAIPKTSVPRKVSKLLMCMWPSPYQYKKSDGDHWSRWVWLCESMQGEEGGQGDPCDQGENCFIKCA